MLSEATKYKINADLIELSTFDTYDNCSSNTAAIVKTDLCPYRCKIWTLIAPYCSAHAKLLCNLQIKPSTIEGAGQGLFAYSKTNEVVFTANQVVGNYFGERLSYDVYEKRYGAALDKTQKLWFTPYAMMHNGDFIIDCFIIRCLTSICNDNIKYLEFANKNGNTVMRISENVFHQGSNGSVCEIASYCDIKNGEELFLNYGDNYWGSYPQSKEQSDIFSSDKYVLTQQLKKLGL